MASQFGCLISPAAHKYVKYENGYFCILFFSRWPILFLKKVFSEFVFSKIKKFKISDLFLKKIFENIYFWKNMWLYIFGGKIFKIYFWKKSPKKWKYILKHIYQRLIITPEGHVTSRAVLAWGFHYSSGIRSCQGGWNGWFNVWFPRKSVWHTLWHTVKTIFVWRKYICSWRAIYEYFSSLERRNLRLCHGRLRCAGLGTPYELERAPRGSRVKVCRIRHTVRGMSYHTFYAQSVRRVKSSTYNATVDMSLSIDWGCLTIHCTNVPIVAACVSETLGGI